MTFNRRTFILSTGIVAAVPALASLLPRAAIAKSPSSLQQEPLPLQPRAAATTTSDYMFKVEGWDVRVSSRDEAWIAVSPSWRTAWR